MSIKTQIDRIKGNVTRALAKVSEKGVTVPNDANSDDLETLIGAIEAGGGGANVVTGSYIKASSGNTEITITHGLGAVPDYLAMIQTTYTSSNYQGVRLFVFCKDITGKYDYRYGYTNYSTLKASVSYGHTSELTASSGFGYNFFLDGQTFTIRENTAGTPQVGAEWQWVAVGG